MDDSQISPLFRMVGRSEGGGSGRGRLVPPPPKGGTLLPRSLLLAILGSWRRTQKKRKGRKLLFLSLFSPGGLSKDNKKGAFAPPFSDGGGRERGASQSQRREDVSH